MVKNTEEVQGYFNRHAGVDVLYFVKGMPFFKEQDAMAQAGNLLKADNKEWPVEKVTRDEAFAMAAVPADINAVVPDLDAAGVQAVETIALPADAVIAGATEAATPVPAKTKPTTRKKA